MDRFVDTYLVIDLNQYLFRVLAEIQETLKALKKLMNFYHDKVYQELVLHKPPQVT